MCVYIVVSIVQIICIFFGMLEVRLCVYIEWKMILQCIQMFNLFVFIIFFSGWFICVVFAVSVERMTDSLRKIPAGNCCNGVGGGGGGVGGGFRSCL